LSALARDRFGAPLPNASHTGMWASRSPAVFSPLGNGRPLARVSLWSWPN
jgi:hypothetical protein